VKNVIGRKLEGLENVVEAHRLMENSEVQRKVVVLVA